MNGSDSYLFSVGPPLLLLGPPALLLLFAASLHLLDASLLLLLAPALFALLLPPHLALTPLLLRVDTEGEFNREPCSRPYWQFLLLSRKAQTRVPSCVTHIMRPSINTTVICCCCESYAAAFGVNNESQHTKKVMQ